MLVGQEQMNPIILHHLLSSRDLLENFGFRKNLPISYEKYHQTVHIYLLHEFTKLLRIDQIFSVQLFLRLLFSF